MGSLCFVRLKRFYGEPSKVSCLRYTCFQVIAAMGGFAYIMDKDGAFRNSFSGGWDKILSKHPIPFYYCIGKWALLQLFLYLFNLPVWIKDPICTMLRNVFILLYAMLNINVMCTTYLHPCQCLIFSYRVVNINLHRYSLL